MLEGGRLCDQPVLLHLAPKRDGTDLQRLGGLAPIAAKTLKRTLDHGSFLCLKIEGVIGNVCARFLRDLRRQFSHPDAGAARNDDRDLYGISFRPG